WWPYSRGGCVRSPIARERRRRAERQEGRRWGEGAAEGGARGTEPRRPGPSAARRPRSPCRASAPDVKGAARAHGDPPPPPPPPTSNTTKRSPPPQSCGARRLEGGLPGRRATG